MEADVLEGDLSGVDREAVAEEYDHGETQNAQHSETFKDQGQDRREPDVLVRDIPAGQSADGEERDRGDCPLSPTAARNWAAKTAKPARPATPMNRYDQMSVNPENTPVAAPNPRPVYVYIDPGEADLRAN